MSDTSKGDGTVKREGMAASGLNRKTRSLDPRSPQSKPADHGATLEEPKRELTAAAKRALDEAEARRNKGSAKHEAQREINGRKGPDPTRYGDWEKDGIISDF